MRREVPREMPRVLRLGPARTMDDTVEDPMEKVARMEASDRIAEIERSRIAAAQARAEAERIKQENEIRRARREQTQLDMIQNAGPMVGVSQQGQSTAAAVESVNTISNALSNFSDLMGKVLDMTTKSNTDLMGTYLRQINDQYDRIQTVLQDEKMRGMPAPPNIVEQMDTLMGLMSRVRELQPQQSTTSIDSTVALQLRQFDLDMKKFELENQRMLQQHQQELLQWREEQDFRREQWRAEQGGKQQQYGLLEMLSQAAGATLSDMRGGSASNTQQRTSVAQNATTPVRETPAETVQQCPYCEMPITLHAGQTTVTCPNLNCGREMDVAWS